MSVDISLTKLVPTEVFSYVLTANYVPMAKEAGIYLTLWYPEDAEYRYAQHLITPLTEAIERLKARPEHFKQFNAPNGWGTYEDFLIFLEGYLEACKANPKAIVKAL